MFVDLNYVIEILKHNALCCVDSTKDDTSVSSWDWNLDGQNSTYHALFPRAWTIYEGTYGIPFVSLFWFM